LFKYIAALERAQQNKINLSRLFYLMEKHSLQRFAMEHEAHDDEMEGIRKITQNYFLSPEAPLHVKVIYTELQLFEKALQTHARIENEILFPKAMALENAVRTRFFERAKFN